MLRAIVLSAVVDMSAYDRVTRHHFFIVIYNALIIEEIRVAWQTVYIDITLAQARVFNSFRNNSADILLLRLEAKKLREVSVGDDLLPLLLAVFLESLGGNVKMRNLLS